MMRAYIVSARPSPRVMAALGATLLAVGAACNATSTDPVVGREAEVIPGPPS